MSSLFRVLMAASTLSTSVTTLGTDTMISTMLFSRPALMLADTACSLEATVERCASRPLLPPPPPKKETERSAGRQVGALEAYVM